MQYLSSGVLYSGVSFVNTAMIWVHIKKKKKKVCDECVALYQFSNPSKGLVTILPLFRLMMSHLHEHSDNDNDNNFENFSFKLNSS